MATAADEALASWIAERCGQPWRRRSPVGGGCIHNAWRLQLEDGSLLFAKTCPASRWPLLAAEADGLAALAAAAAAGAALEPVAPLQVPRPLALGTVAEQGVLLLPWLAIANGREPAAWHRFGAGLAALHRGSLGTELVAGDQPHGRHGWHQDNVIGATPQRNGWSESWGAFFAERRLAPQLQRLARHGRSLAGAADLLAQVPIWLAAHRPDPVLVHGDLWSGNGALLEGGGACVFDPAVYRGDREVDLAMARLFGGFPAAFFAGYAASWPLPPGHQRRVDLYNLYHLLNHANLFGGSYGDRSQALIRELLAHPPASDSR